MEIRSHYIIKYRINNYNLVTIISLIRDFLTN